MWRQSFVRFRKRNDALRGHAIPLAGLVKTPVQALAGEHEAGLRRNDGIDGEAGSEAELVQVFLGLCHTIRYEDQYAEQHLIIKEQWPALDRDKSSNSSVAIGSPLGLG